MKQLKEFKESIHSCSKCGLCQSVCPVYKVTGNDCTVSRGLFIMLKGLIKGELKMSKKLNRYLDLCLKCGACSRFCPSGIDVVDIIVAAKAEYFKTSLKQKFLSFIQKQIIFGLFVDFLNLFSRKCKSKHFEKKVLYFGGCSSKIKGDRPVVKILNEMGVEVINPSFSCCGISLYTRGDLKGFNQNIEKFIKTVKKYNITDIVTTCASCEKSLKDYIKWTDSEESRDFLKKIKVKNLYEYIKENKLKLTLKKPVEVTFHKPCNIDNYENIKWFLNNIENLTYIEMQDYDKCCGLNGISKFSEYKIMTKIFNKKRNNILNTGVKYVLTSCLGCEVSLKLFSRNSYGVDDLTNFIANRI